MRTTLIRALPAATLLAVSLAAPAAAAVINGTSGPDVLVGTPSADTIRGFGGNDTLRGRGSADKLYAGYGADKLYPGDDSRKDVLRGSRGPDRINARTPDVVYAGAGNDTIRVLEIHGWDFPTINCGPGRDTVIADYTGFGMSNCERMVAP
ncbi:MAG: calcium-binding protein [Nocardioidaceae bacterium]